MGDLAKAAELKYGTLLKLQKELEAENQKLQDTQKEGAMFKEIPVVGKFGRVGNIETFLNLEALP